MPADDVAWRLARASWADLPSILSDIHEQAYEDAIDSGFDVDEAEEMATAAADDAETAWWEMGDAAFDAATDR